MSRSSFAVESAINEYVDRLSLREPDVLSRLRAETSNMERAEMQISPLQGQFMAMLAQLIGARRYLEVGVFTGYSSLAVALALPAEGRIVACDVSEEYTSVARKYWQEAGVEEKIDLRLAPAIETLQGLMQTSGQGSFDLAFIDADKANVANYFELCLRLVRVNGLILVDNVLWGGEVLQETTDEDTVAIQRFNEQVSSDRRVDSLVLPLFDGLTLARKLG
jgi:predicted O-methyltransferase YrrM